MINPAIMPSQAFLSSHIGDEFLLADEAGNSTTVVLQSVDDGIPMDETYTCFRVVLLCQPGVQAAQATYQLSIQEKSWLIFLSPTMPEKNGQARLQASFHYSIDQSVAEFCK